MERDIVDRLRAMAGPIVPNVCTEAADYIETLRRAIENLKDDLTLAKRQRDAFRAAPDDVAEIDIDDIERLIKSARSMGMDAIKLSARDLWRMASDRRGRNEPDEEWDDD